MNNFFEVIKRPLVTEKSVADREKNNRYHFEVSLSSSKGSIKAAVESLFKVSVSEVRTMIQRGHFRRVGKYIGKQSNWKKAVVTLKQGQKIDLFDNK